MKNNNILRIGVILLVLAVFIAISFVVSAKNIDKKNQPSTNHDGGWIEDIKHQNSDNGGE